MWLCLWRYAARSPNCPWIYASNADASGQIRASNSGSNGPPRVAWCGCAASTWFCAPNDVYAQGNGRTTRWFYPARRTHSTGRLYATCAANAWDDTAYSRPNGSDGLHAACGNYAPCRIHTTGKTSCHRCDTASRIYATHWLHAPGVGHTACAADAAYGHSGTCASGAADYRSDASRRLHSPTGFYAASRVNPAGRIYPDPAAYARSNASNATGRPDTAGGYGGSDPVHSATRVNRTGGIFGRPWRTAHESALSNTTDTRSRRQLYAAWTDVAARFFCTWRTIDSRTGVLKLFSA